MHYRMKRSLLSCIFGISCLLLSCIKGAVYEKHFAFKGHRWTQKDSVQFSFNITDTASNYLLFLMMRHTEAYPFSNLWLKTNTRLPDGKSTGYLNTEIPLAEESGKWLGRGMNEIWEHKMPLTKNGGAMHFSQSGQYTISLKQIMRMNPLPEIMSIGIRLEKVHR